MKYRSTHTVDAIRYDGTNVEEVREFLGNDVLVVTSDFLRFLFLANRKELPGHLPEGQRPRPTAAVIEAGDYIFRESDGRFSIYGEPGSGKFFLNSYEPIDGPATRERLNAQVALAGAVEAFGRGETVDILAPARRLLAAIIAEG